MCHFHFWWSYFVVFSCPKHLTTYYSYNNITHPISIEVMCLGQEKATKSDRQKWKWRTEKFPLGFQNHLIISTNKTWSSVSNSTSVLPFIPYPLSRHECVWTCVSPFILQGHVTICTTGHTWAHPEVMITHWHLTF